VWTAPVNLCRARPWLASQICSLVAHISASQFIFSLMDGRRVIKKRVNVVRRGIVLCRAWARILADSSEKSDQWSASQLQSHFGCLFSVQYMALPQGIFWRYATSPRLGTANYYLRGQSQSPPRSPPIIVQGMAQSRQFTSFIVLLSRFVGHLATSSFTTLPFPDVCGLPRPHL
jgi:hypothetical protein